MRPGRNSTTTLGDIPERVRQIAPTSKKYVTVLFHPNSKLWVLDQPPSSIWPTILGHFSL